MSHRFNLFDPEFRKNPYPTYKEMRDTDPVCLVDPGGLWAVSRHEDVLFALKHPELFSSQGFRAITVTEWLPNNPLADSLVLLDPPNHTKMRALVSKAFTPSVIPRLMPRVTDIAEELASSLAARGEADFVSDFASLFPSRVICELLGLDPSLHASFNRWNMLLQMVSPVTPAEVIPEIQSAVREIDGYMRTVIRERRSAPRRDLVSDLLGAEVDGQRLTDEEVVAFMVLLLIAGYETTSTLLSKSLLELTKRPAEMDLLRAEPHLLPKFIDEALRHSAPVDSVLRLTTTEVTLSGVTIPAGAVVALLLASANRDERKFAEPDRFQMHRDLQGMVSFGHGIHYCVGAALARAEAKAGYEALLRRFHRFEVLRSDIPYSVNVALRAPLSIPMRFIPVRPEAVSDTRGFGSPDGALRPEGLSHVRGAGSPDGALRPEGPASRRSGPPSISFGTPSERARRASIPAPPSA